MKEYDVELFEPKEGYIGKTPQGVPNSYSRKCTATDDLQPIVLYRKELEAINEKLGDQEGISYSQALPVDGRDTPGSPEERLYICPRYWDRKHGIPLSPEREEHPILNIPYEDEGSTKGWKNFILPRGLRAAELKNNEYFIFERSAKYWDTAGSDLDKYNIIFKSKCHPKFPIPCCGKKKTVEKFEIGNKVSVFMNKKTTYKGEIIKEYANGFYKVSIPNYEGDTRFHVSKLKRIKITQTYSAHDNIPLLEGEKGLPSKEINTFFNIELNIKENGCGLYRVGISQGNDSFLNSILHSLNSVKSRTLTQFKKDICSDIDSVKLLDELVPLFRNDILSCRLKENAKDNFELIMNTSVKEAKENLKKYILSDEFKDSYLLTLLFQKISQFKKNKTFFKKENVRLVVFEKKENKVIIQKPIGGFQYEKENSFLLFFKYETYYEPILLKAKEDNTFCNSEQTKDFVYLSSEPEVIQKNMAVLIGKEGVNGFIQSISGEDYTIEIIEDKSQEVFKEKDFQINQETGEEPNVRIFIYQNEIINRICELTNKDNSINQNLNKEFITYDKCKELVGSEIQNEYIDLSGRVTHLEFNKGNKTLIYPIKPEKAVESNKYTSVLDLPKQKLSVINNYLKEIDTKTDNSVKKYIESSSNSMNQDILFFENMLYLPIEREKQDDLNKYHNRIQAQYNITGSIRENIVTKEIGKYHDHKNTKYRSNMLFLNYLRSNKSKMNKINNIIHHDIMLKIHKRTGIYDILRKAKKTSDVDLKYLPQFIEKLLIHGIERLQNIILNDFSLKDIMNPQKNVYIFKQFQIKNKDYSYIFETVIQESEFIRNISQFPYV